MGLEIDDADRLRAGSTAQVLPFGPVAPSTLGTWLRSFTFGHLRQFDRANELALSRAWSLGAAPAVKEMTLDLDSTVCEVHGRDKQGAAYGHTKTLGYHPLVAVRDDTGEFIHSRMRSGSSQRGHMRFVSETLARMRRLAPDAEVTVRADAGFFSYDLLDLIEARNASWSFTIPQNAKVKAAIAAIDDKAWQSIAYTRGGQAQVAETTIKTGPRSRSAEPRELRLVVRRTRLTGPQAELWPDWRHHCLVTNRADLNTETADTYHRAHARVELAIKDLKADWPTAPQGSSSPTAPTSPAPCSHTTSPAGSHASATPNTPNTSPSRPPPATGSCRCRDVSSTTQAATSCACPSTGPGNTPSPQRCNTYTTCPCSYKRPPRGPAPPAHTPTPPTQPNPNPDPARPNTPNPA